MMDFSIYIWTCYRPHSVGMGVEDREWLMETHLPCKNIVSVGKDSDFQADVTCHTVCILGQK